MPKAKALTRAEIDQLLHDLLPPKMSKRGSWSWSDEELLRRNYATSSAHDIAAVLKRGVSEVYAKARRLDLCPPHCAKQVTAKANSGGVNGRRRTETTERLRAALLAGAEQQNGVAVGEISGWIPSTISNAVMRMKKEGLLFSAKLSHKTLRHFTTAEAAQRYQEARRVPGSAVRVSSSTRLLQAPWPADAPGIITERTKVTIAPAPPRVLRTNTHSS